MVASNPGTVLIDEIQRIPELRNTIQSIVDSCHAKDIEPCLYTFRTRGGLEVDFIFKSQGRTAAIELKSAPSIVPSDLSALKQISKLYPTKLDRFLAYRGIKEQKEDGIWILPWIKVIRELGL